MKPEAKQESKEKYYQAMDTTSVSSGLMATVLDLTIGVPIFSVCEQTARAMQQNRDKRLSQKIAAFLEGLQRFSEEEIAKFRDTMMKDKENFELISEITLHVIEEADSGLIARMVGLAYAKYLSKEIHQITFEIDISVIRGLNLYLLRQLRQIYGSGDISCMDVTAAHRLSNLGLMSPPHQKGSINTPMFGIATPDKSTYGETFYKSYLESLEIPSVSL